MPFRTKKSRIWQYDFVIKGSRFRGSCETEDFEEAKLVEARLKLEAAHAPEATGRFTLGQALGTYYTDVCQHQPSARTAMSQARGLLLFLDEKRDTGALTTADVQAFINSRRADGITPATINRQLDMLDRSLKHMARTNRSALPEIDFRKMRLKEPEERVRELTMEEQEELFKHLRWDLHPFTMFALMTGARLASVAKLRWSDIDRRHGRMTFIGKYGKRYRFPISPEIGALLDAIPRSDDPVAGKFVFLYRDHRRRGYPLTPISHKGGGLMEDFREALEMANIEDFRFHDLRHTFATRVLRKTGNLKLVSRLLGHASIETTMRYAHVLESDLSDAMVDFSIMPQNGPQT
ncbi:Tyrosine recombinase XerC [Paracoccus haematequi]|uniref:Tyrosine recombinase XerC n=1 Tax=Paracoccus haematequi TaxID=2491866 RepID=A0A3S4GSS1_9RHOB|nr:site-specific integrase [Paracoccus haematequi]VDS10075.1 Tyrosine recombinase XerC [Paracoccus haematequi]